MDKWIPLRVTAPSANAIDVLSANSIDVLSANSIDVPYVFPDISRVVRKQGCKRFS
jgi:hypothetical protein